MTPSPSQQDRIETMVTALHEKICGGNPWANLPKPGPAPPPVVIPPKFQPKFRKGLYHGNNVEQVLLSDDQLQDYPDDATCDVLKDLLGAKSIATDSGNKQWPPIPLLVWGNGVSIRAGMFAKAFVREETNANALQTCRYYMGIAGAV